MFGLSFFEMSVIGIIAVVLYGGNLPEAARKFGQSYSQLRRTLHDVQQQFRESQRDIDRAMSISDSKKASVKVAQYDEAEDTPEPSAPKFTPPS